jgi:CheY-like chemotaxis protein
MQTNPMEAFFQYTYQSIMTKKILIVEDENILRENISEMLHFKGFNTMQAANGQEALEKLQDEIPDLIICDLMMPVMNGYCLLQRVKASPSLAHIPFIILTAFNKIDDKKRCDELGADWFLTKPFTLKELLEVIDLKLPVKDIDNLTA